MGQLSIGQKPSNLRNAAYEGERSFSNFIHKSQTTLRDGPPSLSDLRWIMGLSKCASDAQTDISAYRLEAYLMRLWDEYKDQSRNSNLESLPKNLDAGFLDYLSQTKKWKFDTYTAKYPADFAIEGTLGDIDTPAISGYAQPYGTISTLAHFIRETHGSWPVGAGSSEVTFSLEQARTYSAKGIGQFACKDCFESYPEKDCTIYWPYSHVY